MFRAIILSVFRSTRLCVTACGIMHPRCCRPVAWKRRNGICHTGLLTGCEQEHLLLLTSCQKTCMAYTIPPLPGYRPATSWVHYTTSCNTQSSAPEDGQNNCPKHVELIGIINKPLLLHLVGCLFYLYQWCMVKQISNLQTHIHGRKTIHRRFLVCLTKERVRLWENVNFVLISSKGEIYWMRLDYFVKYVKRFLQARLLWRPTVGCRGHLASSFHTPCSEIFKANCQ